MTIDLVIGVSFVFLVGLNLGIILIGFFTTKGNRYESV